MAAECPDCGRERGLKNGDCDIGERYSPDGKLACLRLTVARLREQLVDLEEKHERCLPENSKAWNDEMDRVTSRIDGREKIASLESELTAARAALAKSEADASGWEQTQIEWAKRAEKAEAALAEKDAALRAIREDFCLRGCDADSPDDERPERHQDECLAARRALSEHPPAPAPKEGK